MFCSKRLRSLEYKAESLRSHDAVLDMRLETLREENKRLQSQIVKQRHFLSLLTDHLGVDIRFIEERYEVVAKEEPNVD